MIKIERLSKADVVYAVLLTIASLISYLICYYVLEPFVDHLNNSGDCLQHSSSPASRMSCATRAKPMPTS
jgi:hypothetical protein